MKIRIRKWFKKSNIEQFLLFNFCWKEGSREGRKEGGREGRKEGRQARDGGWTRREEGEREGGREREEEVS